MVQFNCKKCEHSYRVPDHYAGKKVRCKQCNTIIQIPSTKSENVGCGDSVAAFNRLLQQLAQDEITAPTLESDV